jgi:hypothetical protein
MEQFVLQFVTPEFASAEGYMRAIVSLRSSPSSLLYTYERTLTLRAVS